MLAEHVAWPGAARVAVEVPLAHRGEGGHALDHLETVRGNEDRARRRVIAVVRAPDPLHQPLDVLRRTDLDHQIHIAPVDAKIERAGGDNGAEVAGDHRRLDARALLSREASVMDANRQRIVVRKPQVVEEDLGLRPRIVKDQGRLVALDQVEDRGDGVCPAATRPGRRGVGLQHRDVGVGPGSASRIGQGSGWRAR